MLTYLNNTVSIHTANLTGQTAFMMVDKNQ